MPIFDFFGRGARSDITAGTAAANQAIQEGLEDFERTSNQFLNRSQRFLEPGIERGESANRLLEIALGLQGTGVQQGFFDDFVDDPETQALIDTGVQGVERSAAARGGAISGNALRAIRDTASGIRSNVFNNRLNRLSQLGGVGTQLSSQAAGNTLRTGQNIAGAQFGTGQLLANNAIGQANALAQNRSTGLNNLLGIGNVFASAFRPTG